MVPKDNGSMSVREQIDELKEAMHRDFTEVFSRLKKLEDGLQLERYQRKFMVWKVGVVWSALTSLATAGLTSAVWWFRTKGG